jgi:hypothetical protein
MTVIATVLFIVVTSSCLVLAGILIYVGGLSWFGRLPGDIRHRSIHTRISIPLTSTLVLSLSLSLLVYLLRLVL